MNEQGSERKPGLFARMWQGAKEEVKTRATEKLGALAEKHGPKIMERILEKLGAPTALNELSSLLDIFPKGGGGDLLSFLDHVDDLTAQTLASPRVSRWLETAKPFGAAFQSEFIQGVADTTYRGWLEQNPPPLDSDKRDIPPTVFVDGSSTDYDKKVCTFCRNTVAAGAIKCESCNATEFNYKKEIPNPEYAAQQDKIDDWVRRSRAKRAELNLGGNGDQTTVLAAALATAATGGGLGLAGQLFGGKAAAEGPTAVNLVNETLANRKGVNRQMPDVGPERLEYLSTEVCLERLQALMVGKIVVGSETYQNPKTQNRLVADEVVLENGAKTIGGIFCNRFSVTADVGGVDMEKAAIVFDEATGNIPKDILLYVVHDPDFGVEARHPANAIVKKITIDQAYALVKKTGLVQ